MLELLLGGYKDDLPEIVPFTECIKVTTMPVSLAGPMCFVYDDKLYVAGGNSAVGSPVNTVRAYDLLNDMALVPISGTLARGLGMNTIGVLNGRMYTVGGLQSVNAAGTVSASNRSYWADLPSMTNSIESSNVTNSNRAGSRTLAVDGKIYTLLDGLGQLIATTVAGTTATVTNLATMNPAVSGAVVVGANGYIYVIGGWTTSAYYGIHRYDIAKNTWTKIADIPADKHCVWQAGYIDDNGHIGYTGFYNGTIWAHKFDPVSKLFGPSFDTGIGYINGIGHASHNNALYLVGGNTQGYPTNWGGAATDTIYKLV